MIPRYLLDADSVNYILKDKLGVRARYRREFADGAQFVLCPIIHFQVTRYLRLINATRLMDRYQKLIQTWERYEFAEEDWESAAALWAHQHRSGRGVQDQDLLIAICARSSSSSVVTNNTRHFEGLGVELHNWAVAVESPAK